MFSDFTSFLAALHQVQLQTRNWEHSHILLHLVYVQNHFLLHPQEHFWSRAIMLKSWFGWGKGMGEIFCTFQIPRSQAFPKKWLPSETVGMLVRTGLLAGGHLGKSLRSWKSSWHDQWARFWEWEERRATFGKLSQVIQCIRELESPCFFRQSEGTQVVRTGQEAVGKNYSRAQISEQVLLRSGERDHSQSVFSGNLTFPIPSNPNSKYVSRTLPDSFSFFSSYLPLVSFTYFHNQFYQLFLCDILQP